MKIPRITLPTNCSGTVIQADNGGLFISRGIGSHPKRTLPSYEFILVRSGTLNLSEGGRLFKVEKHQSLLLEPGVSHEGVGVYAPDLSFYWVHFRLLTSPESASAEVPKHSRVQRPERLMEQFHRFLDDQESGALTPDEGAAQVMLMLLEARRHQTEPGQAMPDLVTKARTHIKSHFTEGLSSSLVATALRVNADYLGRIFRSATGEAITAAIHREQLREARRLLRESTLNIDEVARASGFKDPSYFRRIFLRHNGSSARDYRKLYARLHINNI